ncbi:MAG: dihydrofolate reductase [Pseudomonadota bacterium]
MPRISILVAVARNGVIGADNRLPWHLPDDLRYFKRLTTGHCVIMGRKTYDSIGRPLPNRRNVVITRQSGLRIDGAEVVHSLDEALAACGGDDEIFVIGGAEIFRQILDRADRLYLTELMREYDGDVFMPEYDRTQWRETSRDKRCADGLEYHYVVYDRV